jgi:hypothetical protein
VADDRATAATGVFYSHRHVAGSPCPLHNDINGIG